MTTKPTPSTDAALIAEARKRERALNKRFAYGLDQNNYDGKLFGRLADALSRRGEGEAFQDRVKPWMSECFGEEISRDKVERGDRLLEETLELLQSGGYDPARVSVLRDYVYARPVGEPSQEVGGVMVCVAAYCLAFGLDMHEAADTELARIWTKVPQIREKQKTKPKDSPLPTLAASPAPDQDARVREGEALRHTPEGDKIVSRMEKHFSDQSVSVDFCAACIDAMNYISPKEYDQRLAELRAAPGVVK